jgi:hypothetical protein
MSEILSVGIFPCMKIPIVPIEQNLRSVTTSSALTGQIQLDLETDVDIGSVDCGTPPKSEPTVWNLVETRPLSIGEFLVLHRLFKTGRLLPEETFPSGEVRALE